MRTFHKGPARVTGSTLDSILVQALASSDPSLYTQDGEFQIQVQKTWHGLRGSSRSRVELAWISASEKRFLRKSAFGS